MLFKWGGRRPGVRPRPSDEPSLGLGGLEADQVLPTKVLKRFLTGLAARPAPTLLDLGTVVGSNVSFFGERLGCKIHVEDIYAAIERVARSPRGEGAASVETALAYESGSIDGILCWDVFDFLDRPTAVRLAGELVRVLAPGGLLVAFFSTDEHPEAPYTRYVIVDELNLRHKPYDAASPRQPVIANRDIARMFDGLSITESFLLLTKTREMLFRKPVPAAAPQGRDASTTGTTPVPPAKGPARR